MHRQDRMKLNERCTGNGRRHKEPLRAEKYERFINNNRPAVLIWDEAVCKASLGLPAAVIIYAAIYISPVRSYRQDISESHNLCQNHRVVSLAGDNQGSPRWANQNQNQAFLTCQPHT
jgi:hypothetical protein